MSAAAGYARLFHAPLPVPEISHFITLQIASLLLLFFPIRRVVSLRKIQKQIPKEPKNKKRRRFFLLFASFVRVFVCVCVGGGKKKGKKQNFGRVYKRITPVTSRMKMDRVSLKVQ